MSKEETYASASGVILISSVPSFLPPFPPSFLLRFLLYCNQHARLRRLLDRGKLAVVLAQQKSKLTEGRTTAMKNYKKQKKAREAAVGFSNLVAGLKTVTSNDAGYGGALGVFKQMDSAQSGSLNQLAFRAGLQELGIKAAAADVNKLWDFMDSDHSGIITYPDFAAGLNVRGSARNPT